MAEAPFASVRPAIKTESHMKLMTQFAVILSLSAATALAQPGPGGPHGFGGPPGRGPHGAPPFIRVLDINTNGVLEATEIANASQALLTLDANGDGKLSADELMPKPPGDAAGKEQRPAPPAGAKRPVPPVMAVLDTNGDGELDATEIANAPAALLQLDVNGDGQLTPDELRPPHAGGGRGPGHRGGDTQPPPQ